MQRISVRAAGMAVVAAVAAAVPMFAQQAPPSITFDDIKAGLKDPSRWISYAGDLNAQRHSPLTDRKSTRLNSSH